jgi:arsenate reductase-like glutaredoxin family protein
MSGGFMIGFDTETETSFQKMVDFAQERGIPLPIVNVLKAPPGTELLSTWKKKIDLADNLPFQKVKPISKP